MNRISGTLAILAVIAVAGCASGPAPTYTTAPDQQKEAMPDGDGQQDARLAEAKAAMDELFNGGPKTKGEIDSEAKAAKMSRDAQADAALEHAIHGGM